MNVQRAILITVKHAGTHHTGHESARHPLPTRRALNDALRRRQHAILSIIEAPEPQIQAVAGDVRFWHVQLRG